jgi:hypothetical protein
LFSATVHRHSQDQARGGFEIVAMEWKDGKVRKAIIKSTLVNSLIRIKTI